MNPWPVSSTTTRKHLAAAQDRAHTSLPSLCSLRMRLLTQLLGSHAYGYSAQQARTRPPAASGDRENYHCEIQLTDTYSDLCVNPAGSHHRHSDDYVRNGAPPISGGISRSGSSTAKSLSRISAILAIPSTSIAAIVVARSRRRYHQLRVSLPSLSTSDSRARARLILPKAILSLSSSISRPYAERRVQSPLHR